MKRIFQSVVLGIICLSISSSSFAQDHKSGDPYLMEQITNQMSEELSDIPVNIRRVAVYKINYSALRFTPQQVEFIRAEVESAMRLYAGLTVLSPPELEPNDKMKIMGNDSTLQILNIRGRSLADVSPEFLTTITDKYGVQGLIELTVQRRYPEGLVISVRMMNPISREVIWTRSFVSNPFEVVEEIVQSKSHMINFGAESRASESITLVDTTGAETDSTLDKTIIDFQVSYTFRQPLNAENSSYVGLSGGFHILKSSEAQDFEINFLEFGVSYYQAVTQMNEDLNESRVMLLLKASAQIPIGKPKGQIFSFNPGLMFNLSENIGLAVYGSIALSGETITLENNNKVTFNRTSYGVQGVIRF